MGLLRERLQQAERRVGALTNELRDAKKTPEPPKAEPKTLDNSLGASPTMVNGSAKTEAERIRRAIEAMEAIEKKQPSA